MARIYKPVKPPANKAAAPVKETKAGRTADKDKKEEHDNK